MGTKLPRGIQYTAVAAVADTIAAEGKIAAGAINSEDILSRTKTGSHGTINGHLDAWRTKRGVVKIRQRRKSISVSIVSEDKSSGVIARPDRGPSKEDGALATENIIKPDEQEVKPREVVKTKPLDDFRRIGKNIALTSDAEANPNHLNDPDPNAEWPGPEDRPIIS